MLQKIINTFKTALQITGYHIGMVISKTGRLYENLRHNIIRQREIESPRSVLITGASSGLGAELARQYSAPGVFLYLTGRDSARLGKVAGECVARGARVETVSMDICDDLKVGEWVKSLPRIDLAIANAGVSGGSAEGIDNDEVREIFSVNVGGVINVVLPMVEKARKQQPIDGYRGHIAIMSSIAGLHAMPSAPAYSASKARVTAYGDALRGALKHEGILVSTIGPGYIRTPLTASNNFKMPMLMEAGRAAYIIRKGLARRKSRIYFPKTMYFLLRFINMLPLFLTDPAFRRLPKKCDM